jgi:hypothetical protein
MDANIGKSSVYNFKKAKVEKQKAEQKKLL